MSLRADDRAQDSLEYLLVIGGFVALLIVGLIAGFYGLVPVVVGWACPSIDTAANPVATAGSCLGSLI